VAQSVARRPPHLHAGGSSRGCAACLGPVGRAGTGKARRGGRGRGLEWKQWMGGDTARGRRRIRSGACPGKCPGHRPVGVLSDCVVHLYLWCTPQGAGCRRACL